jgi:hypothetical protein
MCLCGYPSFSLGLVQVLEGKEHLNPPDAVRNLTMHQIFD